MNTPDITPALSGSSSWEAATAPQTQAPPDEYAYRREHHRLRDLVQPWIRQISASCPVPHPAVIDFNLATERFTRLDDPARLPGALEQVRLACDAIARIVAPPSNTKADATAIPLPPATPSVTAGTSGPDRLNQSRLFRSSVELAAVSTSPAAFELFKMRLSMLQSLDDCAAQVLQAWAPGHRDRRRADWAMDQIERILQACRHLIALPDTPLAALAAEEVRVTRKLRDLCDGNRAIQAQVENSSERFIRLVAVYTAGTIQQHAEALSTYEAFLDVLAGGPPVAPGAVRHEPPAFRAPPNRNP